MPARASHAKFLLLLLAAGAAVGALLLWIALGTGREGTAEVELPDPETAAPVAALVHYLANHKEVGKAGHHARKKKREDPQGGSRNQFVQVGSHDFWWICFLFFCS
jgi:hypothetical protein